MCGSRPILQLSWLAICRVSTAGKRAAGAKRLPNLAAVTDAQLLSCACHILPGVRAARAWQHSQTLYGTGKSRPKCRRSLRHSLGMANPLQEL